MPLPQVIGWACGVPDGQHPEPTLTRFIEAEAALVNRQLTLSAPPATIWNGWRNIGKGVFSDYGRFLAEGKFDDIVRLTKQL